MFKTQDSAVHEKEMYNSDEHIISENAVTHCTLNAMPGGGGLLFSTKQLFRCTKKLPACAEMCQDSCLHLKDMHTCRATENEL